MISRKYTRETFTDACRLSLVLCAVLLCGVWAAPPEDADYVGAKKCKNCHRVKSHGDQWNKWEESKHAKAFETLATPEAIKVGKAKGIAVPQKSDECLKCHVTAFGVDKKLVHKKFDIELGVQCESCHGPGSVHAKKRLMAAAQAPEGQPAKIPTKEELANEIARGTKEKCLECHNEKSPTAKAFNYEERWKEIGHLKPQ